MRFVGIDVATVNAAVATSTGEAIACQPPAAKKNPKGRLVSDPAYRNRWSQTDAMFSAIADAVDRLHPKPTRLCVGLEDIRFAGGGKYDDAGELRGMLKFVLTRSARVEHAIALQPQQWRSVMNIANGLPQAVRMDVYHDRARALGYVAIGGDAKSREDRTSAFLLAKVVEWMVEFRYTGGLADLDLTFPINFDALKKLVHADTSKEEWLK